MATATQVTPARSRSGTFGSVTKAFDPSWLLGMGHTDTEKFEEAVKRCIPCNFLLIASQDDYTQAQEDYFAIDHFKLGAHVPRFVQKANAGSVATCALLQLMYENPKLVVADKMRPGDTPINVMQLSKELKKRVKEATKLDARPTISSSRPLGPPRLEKDNPAPFFIVPPNYKGTRRALLIGVVNGEGEDLKGTPNDVTMMQQFLTKECDFKPENVMVLQDYHRHGGPEGKSTKKNILKGFDKLIRNSQPGDVCFIQFSGHGGRMGNNLYILPSDYKTAGQIMDEEILRDLIKAMPADCYTTMLVDCCYSGTVGDLPYVLQSGSSKQSIDAFYDTDMRKEMLEKESEDAEGYAQYKQARAEKRVMSRLTAAIVEGIGKAGAAAGAVVGTAAQAGLDVGMAVGSGAVAAGTAVGGAALTGATAVGGVALSGATAVGGVALSGASAAGNVALSGATVVGGVALSGASAASKGVAKGVGAGIDVASSGAALAGKSVAAVGSTAASGAMMAAGAGLGAASTGAALAGKGAAAVGSTAASGAIMAAGAGLDVTKAVGKTGVSALKGSANIASSAASAGLSASTTLASSAARNSAATASLAAAAAASTAMAGLKGSVTVASSVTDAASAGLKGSTHLASSVTGVASAGLRGSTKVAAAGMRGSVNVLGTLPLRSKSLTEKEKPVFETGRKSDSLSLSGHARADREFTNSANTLLAGRRTTLSREGGSVSGSLNVSDHSLNDQEGNSSFNNSFNSANALLQGRRATLQREKSVERSAEDQAEDDKHRDSNASTPDVRSSLTRARAFSHSPTRAAFNEMGRSRSSTKKKAFYDASFANSSQTGINLEDSDSEDEFANDDDDEIVPDEPAGSRGRSVEPRAATNSKRSSSISRSGSVESENKAKKRSSSLASKSAKGDSEINNSDDGLATSPQEDTRKENRWTGEEMDAGSSPKATPKRGSSGASVGKVEKGDLDAGSSHKTAPKRFSSGASVGEKSLDAGSGHKAAPKRSDSGASLDKNNKDGPGAGSSHKRTSSVSRSAHKRSTDLNSSSHHKRTSSLSKSSAHKQSSAANGGSNHNRSISPVPRKSAVFPKPLVIEDPIPRPRRASKSPKRMGSGRLGSSMSSLGSSFRKTVKRSLSGKKLQAEGEDAAKNEEKDAVMTKKEEVAPPEKKDEK